jgi:PIN domain nuclease of toxin-antitoxin system
MRFLMDTHTFLWFVMNDSRLGDAARTIIEEPDNEIYLSLASVWEISIKVGLGKLILSQPLDAFFPDQLSRNDIKLLPIELNHAVHVAILPLRHRDPFDRLLIAQSVIEGMALLSVDAAFDAYEITRIW